MLDRGVMSTGMARSLDKMLVTLCHRLKHNLTYIEIIYFFLSNLDLFVQSTVDASDCILLENVEKQFNRPVLSVSSPMGNGEK